MAAAARLHCRQQRVRTWRMHCLVRVDPKGPGQNLSHDALQSASFLHTDRSWRDCAARPRCAFAAVRTAAKEPWELACCSVTVGRRFDSWRDGVCLGNILLAWMGDRFPPESP